MHLFPQVLQLLVVVSPDWNGLDGVLYRYQRGSPSLQWELVGSPIGVALGEQGMAWGRGLFDCSHEKGMHKKEGDWRAPAGVFSLGPAFGDERHQPYARKIPFLLVADGLECVDDPDSVHYNRFITEKTAHRDWKSSEKMKEIGFLYAIGLVIQHNLNPIKPGMGSAIFMHVWRQKGMGTAGCTAMEEKDLDELVSWLDMEQSPCLVQLPSEEYMGKKSLWGLPELSLPIDESQYHFNSNEGGE